MHVYSQATGADNPHGSILSNTRSTDYSDHLLQVSDLMEIFFHDFIVPRNGQMNPEGKISKVLLLL